MSPFFQSESFLKQKDFYLLSDVYCLEIEKMLPVRGTVVFWGPIWNNVEEKEWAQDKGLEDQLAVCASSLNPGIVKDTLILPFHLEDGENIAAVIKGIDPGLLGKMAQEWLTEFRESVQVRLENTRKDFIDPVTGLYTSRLLLSRFDHSPEKGQKVLFLICAKSKTRRVTDQLPKTVQIGRFIDAITSAPLFYLGGNVFGLLQDNLTRRESLKTAHQLLNRLKREGLHSAHIGISIQDDDKAQRGAVPVLHECWQALETAERRGIFSLCEGSYLADRESHPLALPPHQVVSILRRKWRGARQFGLIRLSIEDVPAETFEEFEFDKTVAGTLPEGVSFTSVSSREGYILAPDLPAEKILSLGKRIKKKVESEHKTVSVALGVSHWPLLNYTKTQSVVNCIKALMHGRFFGSGSVTVFDHVSLNVSGDYFFDEGDYRQAVRDYRTGVLLAPDDINLLNSLGVALTALNRLREAVVYFDRVLAIDSGDFMALVNMGFAHRILGNEDKAIRCFEKASRHTEFADSPVFDELSLQLARLYCDKEIYDSALELLKRLDRSQNGRQGYSLFLLQGEACAGIGQHKEAVSFLQKAVRINPHDPHALSLLGELYALDEQGDEIALSLCQKAVSIDDASWKHWYRLALVQLRMGRLEEAREAVQESLRINRKAVEALSLAEQIYMQLGVLSKARSMHNRLLKIARTDHKAVKAMLN